MIFIAVEDGVWECMRRDLNAKRSNLRVRQHTLSIKLP